MLDTFLSRLGLSDKERKMYLVLAELGSQPASAVARRAGLDRVTAYKNLKKLAERGLVRVSFRSAVQSFGLENLETLEASLRERASEFDLLLRQLPLAASTLRSLRDERDIIPRLQMFEGISGIRSLLRDLVMEAGRQNIRQIRILSANTFEEWTSDDSLRKAMRNFAKDLEVHGLQVELFEATGGLVPERLQRKLLAEKDMESIPIVRGTTSLFVCGNCAYAACYKGAQIGLKIKQTELSQIFHFLFDVLGKQK